MIDCGMSFGVMKPELYKCDALLITHTHSDHIKKQTFNKILQQFPRIQTFANPSVAYKYHINTVISTEPFRVKDVSIVPYIGEHDVEVTYFTMNINGIDLIYATDTRIVENPNGIKFDYLFLESNYDEQKLREIGHQYATKGYDPYFSNQRHMSTQQCKAFYYMSRKSKESPLIELHKSQRFY